MINTLSNIFTMRLIGNKTHGDLAEVGIAEFINQYIYDLGCIHVGKQFYRSKTAEEDIMVFDRIKLHHSSKISCDLSTFSLLNQSEIEVSETINNLEQYGSAIPISLKAYGIGPLQLTTDKENRLFSFLENKLAQATEDDKNAIDDILSSDAFFGLNRVNVLSLIYDEKNKECRIVVFDKEKAFREVRKIRYKSKGNGRKHPIYEFLDKDDNYIFEVRYGGKSANALQRGAWTHTKKASSFFIGITEEWVSYKHNFSLVSLIALALNASKKGHDESNDILKKDIEALFSHIQRHND